ncbi:hypothetical protein [Arthrobacter sp. H14-L1]|uniref:hypothetical protein n=1 Tax=Arthrobacter sp. H14-L1 TaxID=2996697 RepID=UPI00226E17D0|nr:hypothetical protein [Arthrobacter sp. H14-L1]MCY0903653.1 hypothetical protein [Arthrobacter sp. H14-L1]
MRELMRELMRAAVRLHILHHTAEADVHGTWMSQLANHGYSTSPWNPASRAVPDGQHGLLVSREEAVSRGRSGSTGPRREASSH